MELFLVGGLVGASSDRFFYRKVRSDQFKRLLLSVLLGLRRL